MLKILLERKRQKMRTFDYPAVEPVLPDRFMGRPVFDPGKCPKGCLSCVSECPTEAISARGGVPVCDLGRCVFCGECIRICPEKAISPNGDWRLGADKRQALVTDAQSMPAIGALGGKLRSILGRSLKLREISAGGCNACEADANVLTTPVFDIARFGIEFVASPRHADGIYVTGPVPDNMRAALLKTYEAVPTPRIVIAAGACAISGGAFAGLSGNGNGLEKILPVDLYLPGCPVHPYTVLDGVLKLLGRI